MITIILKKSIIAKKKQSKIKTTMYSNYNALINELLINENILISSENIFPSIF